MSEETVLNLNYLWTELVKVSIILQRPVVQIQLLAMVVTIFLAWLISKWSWIQFKELFPKLSQFELSKLKVSWQQYGAALIRHLLTPSLSLLAVSCLKIGFEQWGWFAGYLHDGIIILWYLWFYRLILISLYALFPNNSVSRYRQRFFAPLFFLFVTGIILNWFLDLQKVSQVSLINLFGQSVTLESAFITTGGLYFWIVGTFLLEKLFLKIFLSKNVQDTRVKQVISLLLRYFLIGLGIVLICGYAGISPAVLATITGGLSVGIGFGLKEVISNFVSGIWLLFEGALKPGDIITIEGKMSQVIKLGIRATTVQVINDNSEEIIPNQTFFTQNVSTLTGSNQLVRLSLIVGASYRCSPAKVIEVLSLVARNHPRILKNPIPLVFALGFGDSSIDFELKFWLDDPLIVYSVTSDMVCEIWQAFADNDIEIPYPQRDLHIRTHEKLSNDNFLELTEE